MDIFTSVLSPGTKQASEILVSFYIMMGVAAFIFALVAGLVTYTVIKFRHREGRKAEQFHENVKLEVIWITIPILIVTGLFFLGAYVMAEVDPPLRGRQPDLTVIAHQWWWELHYSPSGVTTANEFHLPVGKKLLVRFKSADVIHTFWVPSLGQKIDIIPGHPNHLWLTIERPGMYKGTCNSFCGMGHANMHILVIAQSPQDFDDWIKSQQQPAFIANTPQALNGFTIFAQKNCIDCHSINGLAARGHVAPDLTHIASRQTLAAGTLPNTPENLTLWLTNPQDVKRGAKMPDIGLNADQVKSLVAFLEGLK